MGFDEKLLYYYNVHRLLNSNPDVRYAVQLSYVVRFGHMVPFGIPNDRPSWCAFFPILRLFNCVKVNLRPLKSVILGHVDEWIRTLGQLLEQTAKIR